MISNTQFKNVFEKKINVPSHFSNILGNKELSLIFRTKNIPNENFFAYNKLGFSITDKISNNTIYAGIDLDKINQAKHIFDNSISYWNLININKKQKIEIENNRTSYFSPFIYFFSRKDWINKDNTYSKLVCGVGFHMQNSGKPNFKINLLSNLTVLNKLDFSAQIKFKRINLNLINKEIESILEKEVKI